MDDYETINVEAQMKVDNPEDLSVWQFWQRGLHDRKEHADIFIYGDLQELDPQHSTVYAYARTSQKGERWLVVLEFSGNKVDWTTLSELEVDF